MITVKNPVLDVFEKWLSNMQSIKGITCSMQKSAIPNKYPYSNIYMMGAPGNKWDLDGNESAIIPAFQVDSYAKGQKALSKAYEIDDISHQAMTEMGFRRTYGPEQIEGSDKTVVRVVSRYNRLYCGESF